MPTNRKAPVDYGIDVSSWQGSAIDWHAVRAHNITYNSVKLTEGTTYTNPLATSQVDGARSAGIATGGYHYARPDDVAGQVDHFAASLAARGLLDRGSLWPMLDVEHDGFGDPDGFTAEFISRFRDRTGAPLLVYANQHWFTRLLHPDEWADESVLLWVAQYNDNPGHPDYAHPRLAIHQHGNQGHVDGISGHVDLDVTVNGRSRSAFVIGAPPVPETG